MMAENYDSGIVESAFPTGALVPKMETGVLNFLQKFPDFDGRDVTIAIFDSGVDPRATGLVTLRDGKTIKVIERFDCTGCGDVDVSKTTTADEKGFIKGISGRQLKLTQQMLQSNTSNSREFHIGLKSFHDLCPSKIRENITSTVKLKHWDGPHKAAIAEATRKAVAFESNNSDTAKLSWDKKLIKENIDNILELLNNYEKIYNEIKVSYDCILYSTEKGWRAVIDITENGDLENALHIGEYSKTHEIKNVDDYLSISINAHDDGNILEIVGMCSSHGTHVASIASGNHTTRELDGVAPNAKIISLTIGDGRLGSMETGTALVRAMMKVIELCRSGRKVDVINMSYGEHANWSNSGRVGELMNEVVNKYGVVWVASAGNHGPALSTVGTPPDISQSSIIGVGAYVSPQMMEAEYAMREKLPGNVYTWTSRDPCIDGGQGVTICAPGGAITSVPQFTMSKTQLMNGTSMAAPHVAGAIALLISGLKQRKMQYSPYSIRRALSVTANKLGYVDPFAQGHGLLNIEKAFEHLIEHQHAQEKMLRFSVRVGINQAKGIHIRTNVLKKNLDYNVTIEPVFFNEKEVLPSEKFNFNVRLNLIPSQSFVQCGAFLDLSYGPRIVVVRVDPTGLPPGVHSAVIRAFDTDCVQKGPLFEIPITVIQPHVLEGDEIPVFRPVSYKSDGSIDFEPNTIIRDFILVPEKATWAVLHLRTTDTNRDKELGKFFVHTNQLLPKSSCRKLETMKILAVNSEYETTTSFKVHGGKIIELCVAKYWSNYGHSNLKYSLEFRGVKANNRNAYIMHAGRGIHKFEITSLVSEEIQPQLQLKQAVVVLKPSESKISPLSATRDVIPDGRQIYQNLLTYNISVPKAQEIAFYAPIFNDLLYEAEYESQLWMLFDTNKALIATGDAHSHTFYSKLEKGDYTVRLQIRHEKRDALEKISEASMIAVFKLANTLNIDLYDTYNQCVVGGRKFTAATVKEAPAKVLYAAPIMQERLTKASLPQHTAWLMGLFSLPKDEAGRRANSYEFTYILTPIEKKTTNGNGSGTSGATCNASPTVNVNALKPKCTASPTENATGLMNAASGDGINVQTDSNSVNANASPSSPKKGKSTADDYAESLRDFQCAHITKCDLEKAEQIYNEVIVSHPKHLVAHLLLAQNIESTDLKSQLPLTFANAQKVSNISNEDQTKDDKQKLRTALKRVIKLVDLVINETDKDELLSYYGLKTDARSDATKIKTNMDRLKNNLLEALVRKGIALAKLGVIDNDVEASLDDLNNIYLEIIKFSDPNDAKVMNLTLWHAYANNYYGRMYKLVSKLLEEKRSREGFEELAHIMSALRYTHIRTLVERQTISAFPGGYRLF